MICRTGDFRVSDMGGIEGKLCLDVKEAFKTYNFVSKREIM